MALRTGPAAAGRQAYTCGMWREAAAYNNNTPHTQHTASVQVEMRKCAVCELPCGFQRT